MSVLTTVARPYAKAAFEFAVEQGAIQEWEQMLGFAAHVVQDPAMDQFLKGAAGRDKITEVFINICGDQLNEHGQNFIRTMAVNGRLTVLPKVAELFAAFKADHEQEVSVEVAAATELNDEAKAKLSAALEKRLARKVKLNCSVDPSLVGGLRIEAGDLVIDGTLRGKLQRLASTLQA